MAKSRNSQDEGVRCKIVSEELSEFNRLVEGHRKLLIAIGEL